MATNTPVKTGPTTPARPVMGLWDEPFGFPLFHRLSRELDAMFKGFGIEAPTFDRMPTTWNPTMEVYTKGNEFYVKVDVPGMKKEEVTVEVNTENLVVRGERKEEKEEKKEGFYKTERTYGSFFRTVPLPEGVMPDTAKASMADGVLTITMPMTAKVEEKTRTVEIGEPVAEAPVVKETTATKAA
ncbi:MAG: Hsp20/alpha crystallin family protein [Vicinamibacterales bacterium]